MLVNKPLRFLVVLLVLFSGLTLLASVASAQGVDARAEATLALGDTVSRDDAPAGGPTIVLTKTVGTDPSVCATTDVITVPQGTNVTYCYEVTNISGITLTRHDLVDSELGVLLDNFSFDLAPGASVFVTDSASIVDPTVNTATWTARSGDPYGYLDSNDPNGPTYNFIDISSTGTPLNLGDDDEASATIGFNFTYFGVTSNQVLIGNNGGILFNTTSGDISFVNQPLPDAFHPLAIFPFWDDIDSETGNVYYQTLGTAPNRMFVVQWENRPHFPGPGPGSVTFELILMEGSNDILFQYEDVVFGDPQWDFGASATVGLNQNENRAVQYSYESPVLENSFAIRFFVQTVQQASDSDSATVFTVGPEIDVDPASLFESHPSPPQVTTQPLTISNSGNISLTWTITEAPAAHVPQAPVAYAPLGDPADASMARAPRADKLPERSAAADERLADLLGGVPAFGVDLFGPRLVSFSTSNPGTLATVGPVSGDLYAGDFLGGDFSQLYAVDATAQLLYRIDTATAAQTPVGPMIPNPGESWTGMAADASTGTLYASSSTCASSTLYTINPSTGGATAIGSVSNAPCLIDIAVNAAGQMYGVDIINDVLLSIDPGTGAGTVIGSIGFNANFAQGMDFDEPSNTLYMAAYNGNTGQAELRTLDTATGNSTLIGPLGSGSGVEIDAFAIATGGGGCSMPSDVPWLSLSTTGGTTPPGGFDTLDVTFDSTGLGVGLHEASLCIASNDFDEPLVVVPVTLEVQGPLVALDKTVGTDPSSCGTADAIAVGPNSDVTYCYTVTNTGFVTLTRHDLVDSELGTILSGLPYSLTPGASVFVTQTTTITTDTVNSATWTAYNPGPTDVVSATDVATVTIAFAGPDIDVDPLAMTETHTGTTTTTSQPLTISNLGDQSLVWDLYEESTPPILPDLPLIEAVAGRTPAAQGKNALARSDAAPAAPHGQQPRPNLGGITITHSASQDIVQFNSVACNSGGFHTDNGYFRRFDLADDFGIVGTFDVTQVEFGVETAMGAGGDQPVEVRLYSIADEAPLSLANLTPIGSVMLNLPDQSLTIASAAVSGAVDASAGDELVVEIFTPNGQTEGNSFFIGSNPAGQTAPSYIYAPDCGTPDITDLATLGFPNMHIVMNVTGDVGGGACNTADDIPWASAAPTSGTVAPGGSASVTVTFDSAALVTGTYTGTLCIESNDPDEPRVRVPLTLVVNRTPTAVDVATLHTGATPVPLTLAWLVGGITLVVAGGYVLRRRQR